MKIPFHWQKNDYSCGPACLQMVLHASGIRITQKTLIQQTGANSKIGTSRDSLRRVLAEYKLPTLTINHEPLSTIQNYLLRRNLVIVNYQEPGEGEDHYAVVKKITKSSIILLDPWHGSSFKLPKPNFLELWNNPKLRRKFTGWALVVKPRNN